MPEEDEGSVDDVDVEDTKDVRVGVTDVKVVVAEEEVVVVVVEEEEEEVEVDVEEEDVEVDVDDVEEDVEEVEEEEVEEDKDVVPSSEAPFLTVKVSLTASWPPESIIWIS